MTATRILLVDDDVELLDMLKIYLEREGFAVTATSDAEAGVAAALSGEYALAALDVMMPRMSGLEVLSRIRMTSRIPVLMLTAKGEDADRIVGLELGADDYVPKPCTPRELVARIRAILRAAQSLSATAARRMARQAARSHQHGVQSARGIGSQRRTCCEQGRAVRAGAGKTARSL